MTTKATMSASSIHGMFMSRKSGPDSWQNRASERMLEACERGGPIEKIIKEHREMHAFLCLEMNIGLDTVGYEDWYSRFKRPDTAERIKAFLLALEEDVHA
jgi:hypothetical protein